MGVVRLLDAPKLRESITESIGKIRHIVLMRRFKRRTSRSPGRRDQERLGEGRRPSDISGVCHGAANYAATTLEYHFGVVQHESGTVRNGRRSCRSPEDK